MINPTTSAPRRRVRLSVVVLATLLAGPLLVSCSNGHDTKKAAAGPLPAANTELGADAPKWCEHLVTTAIQQMAAALPDVAAGMGPSTASGAAVVAGAEELRKDAGDVPAEVAPTLLETAKDLSAFVNHPEDRATFEAATTALKNLSAQAHQECGL